MHTSVSERSTEAHYFFTGTSAYINILLKKIKINAFNMKMYWWLLLWCQWKGHYVWNVVEWKRNRESSRFGYWIHGNSSSVFVLTAEIFEANVVNAKIIQAHKTVFVCSEGYSFWIMALCLVKKKKRKEKTILNNLWCSTFASLHVWRWQHIMQR